MIFSRQQLIYSVWFFLKNRLSLYAFSGGKKSDNPLKTTANEMWLLAFEVEDEQAPICFAIGIVRLYF